MAHQCRRRYPRPCSEVGHNAPVLSRSLLAWHSDNDNQSFQETLRRILFLAHALPRECGAYLAQGERKWKLNSCRINSRWFSPACGRGVAFRVSLATGPRSHNIASPPQENERHDRLPTRRSRSSSAPTMPPMRWHLPATCLGAKRNCCINCVQQ